MRLSFLFLVPVLLMASLTTSAQLNGPHDSSYYKAYTRSITGRVFLSQKYTRLTMDAPGTSALTFVPNNPFTVGIGATYGIATLNLGLGLPGFTDKDKKGKTTSLDLQSHIYARAWVVDLYGQFYKGYYLTPKGKAATGTDEYYKRRDIRVSVIGASAYHLFNSERFSYRAGFLQNEWQKRSAGSFLLGGEVYYGLVKADSTLGPRILDNSFTGIDRASFVEFGPGAGYAYTFVLNQHYFVTASGTVNGDLSFTRERTATGSVNKTSISPNFTLRAVAGYNSDRWSASVSWVENNLNANGQDDRSYLVRTRNVRLTLAKRFRAGKKLRKKMEIIEQAPDKVIDTN